MLRKSQKKGSGFIVTSLFLKLVFSVVQTLPNPLYYRQVIPVIGKNVRHEKAPLTMNS
jgi:hypothetical protein